MADQSKTDEMISGQETVAIKEQNGQLMENIEPDVKLVETKELYNEPVTSTVMTTENDVEMVENKQREIEPVEKNEADIDMVENKQQDIEPVEKNKPDVDMVENKQQDIEPVEKNKPDVDMVENKQQDIEPVEKKKADIEPVETEELFIDPVGTDESDIDPVKNCDQDIDPVKNSEQDIEPVKTDGQKIDPVKTNEQNIEPVQTDGRQDFEMVESKEEGDIAAARKLAKANYDTVTEEATEGQETVEQEKEPMSVVRRLLSLVEQTPDEINTGLCGEKGAHNSVNKKLFNEEKPQGAEKRPYPYDPEHTEMTSKEPHVDLKNDDDVMLLSQ